MHIGGSLLLRGQLLDIRLEIGSLFGVGHIAGILLEGKSRENVGAGIGQLILNGSGILALQNDVLYQSVGIADGSGKHGGGGVLVGTDDAGHLPGGAVVIEVLQARLSLTEVCIQAGGFILGVAVGIEYHPEIHGADLLKGPTPAGGLHLSLVKGSLSQGVNVLLGGQTQGIEGHIVDLVVFIHNNDDLIIGIGPGAIDHVVLVFQHSIDQAAVFTGQKLLPQLESTHGTHGAHIHTEGFAHVQHGGNIHAEILDQQFLQQLLGIGPDDGAVHTLRVDQHIQIVGVLNALQRLTQITFRIGLLLLDVGLECLQIVFGGFHGT